MFKAPSLLSWVYLAVRCFAVDPAAVYDGDGVAKDAEIALKIGNGGAGQSGLVGGRYIQTGCSTLFLTSAALSNAFVKESVKDNGTAPFRVAWYKSDTTQSINYLKDKVVDVGITYTQSAEEVAINEQIAQSPIYYLFRDHFLIVGPPENPANLSKSDDPKTIFSKLYNKAEAGDTETPVRFLSRYDKSATNIKESLMWIDIGQTPWANPTSTWYHEYIAYPIQALTAAAYLKEYTLTDRGTILSLNKSVADETVIYKAATDDEDDPLLNPAHLLIGEGAPKMAQTFTDWALGPNGQKVITDFKKNGEQLYSAAPKKKTVGPTAPRREQKDPVQVVIGLGKEEWMEVVRPKWSKYSAE